MNPRDRAGRYERSRAAGAAQGGPCPADAGQGPRWSTETVTVPLQAGANTIRLAATAATGLPNIDFIEA